MTMRRSDFALAALGALALLGWGSTATRAQDSSATSFLEQVEVRVINVDVVVLDKDGVRVTGLERDDFEVLENGKPVELTNFSAYGEESIAGGDATATLPDLGADAAEAAAETPPAPPLTWAFFVDQMKMDPGIRNHVLKQLATFSARSIREGDRALTATYDGLSLKILSPLGPAAEAVLLGEEVVEAGLLQRQRHEAGDGVLQADIHAGEMAGLVVAARAALVQQVEAIEQPEADDAALPLLHGGLRRCRHGCGSRLGHRRRSRRLHGDRNAAVARLTLPVGRHHRRIVLAFRIDRDRRKHRLEI